MFEKIKQIGKIKKIQKSLGQEEIEVEKKGVQMIVNGNLKVIRIVLNPELSKEEQENALKECFNEGIEKVKASMAQEFLKIS